MNLAAKIAAEGVADRELSVALHVYCTKRDSRDEGEIIDPMPVLDAEHACAVSTIRTGPLYDAPLGSGLSELHDSGDLRQIAYDVRDHGALRTYTRWFGAGGKMDKTTAQA